MLSHQINDEAIRAILGKGGAYNHATKDFLEAFSPTIQNEIKAGFTSGLQFTWQISLVFGGCALLLAVFIPQVSLRKDLETRFGLEET